MKLYGMHYLDLPVIQENQLRIILQLLIVVLKPVKILLTHGLRQQLKGIMIREKMLVGEYSMVLMFKLQVVRTIQVLLH
jgi:hypothetical protein